MNEELEVLKLIANRLDETSIEYFISGSMAANYYTVPRMTRDIDVVVELKRESIKKFIQLFERDFHVDEKMIERETLQKGIFNLIHRQYLIKIDFIVRKDTPFQDSCFLRKKKISIDQTPIWLISVEDLILNKLLWAKDTFSELQLNDIKNLLETSKGLDMPYIEDWIEKLDLNQIYNKLEI